MVAYAIQIMQHFEAWIITSKLNTKTINNLQPKHDIKINFISKLCPNVGRIEKRNGINDKGHKCI
jgi:hypothetical protein